MWRGMAVGIRVRDEKTGNLVWATEANSQLWYSQGPSGSVAVFLAPYTSKGNKVHDDEIIIGHYAQPVDISACEIDSHLRLFLRYCVATSAHTGLTTRHYLFRRMLQLRDFRTRSEIYRLVMPTIEKVLVLVLAAAGVWATLYTGNKL